MENLNLNDFPDFVCPGCGGKMFFLSVAIKFVPAFAAGTPVPVLARIPSYNVCVTCGHVVSDDDVKEFDKNRGTYVFKSPFPGSHDPDED